MKILYILNSGQPGGMEKHVLDLVKGMVGAGHTVFVWCQVGPIKDWFEEAGAQVIANPIKYDVDPFYILKLRKFIKQNEIQVVHSHELKSVVNTLLAGRGLVAKHITHTHTPISEWKVPSLIKRINLFLYTKLVNKYSSYEIALTESRKAVKMKEGIQESKLVVIPNALEVSKFELSPEEYTSARTTIRTRYQIPQEALVFGNIGRLTIEKGIPDLLNAYNSLLLKYKDLKESTKLLLVGGGEQEEVLWKSIRNMGIEQNCIITGKFAEEDLVKFYASLDVFIHPSHAEGFGIVLLEALAARKPVICTDIPVFKEVAAKTVYAYYPVGDYLTLAEEMKKVHDSYSSISIDAGYIRVKSFYNMETFWGNYAKLYSSLLTQ